MYTKSLTIMALITASIARADILIEEQLVDGKFQGRDLKSVDIQQPVLGGDASGIFGLFDVDSNGNIQPTEITQAYKFMNTKANDNLKQNELLKAMDGEIRAFCGVGPATEAEIKEEQEDEDNDASEDEDEDDEEEEPKSRNDRRNRGGRGNRNNRGNKGRGGRGNRNRGGQDEVEPAVLGEDLDMPKHHELPMDHDIKMLEMPKEEEKGENNDSSEFEFDAGKEPDFSEEKLDFNDEAMFEDDGEGGRRLRAGRGKRGRRAQKGQWKKQMRSRGNKGNKGKNARRGGRGKKCKRCGKVSKKSLAKKRMSKGLFGILDANHNKNISLKEMFRPFSMADKDFDYNVSFAEFNQMISKAKKPICKQYIRKARKTAIKTWYEMGVPAAERKGKN